MWSRARPIMCLLGLSVVATVPDVRASEKSRKDAPVDASASTTAPQSSSDEAAGATEAAKEADGNTELSVANEALYLENFPRAARWAYRAMAKTKRGTEKHESAEFVFGHALLGAGYFGAASEHVLRVVQDRENPALLGRAYQDIERLAKAGWLDDDALMRAALVEVELLSLSDDVADFVHFQRGLFNLRTGLLRWAKKDFDAVRVDGAYGNETALAWVAEEVRNGKIDAALVRVDALVSAIQERNAERRFRTASTREEDTRLDVSEDVRLMRARLLYEVGRYSDALEEYQYIHQTSDAPAGEILLERAWAYYHSGRYHDAMGLLYALRAPAHRVLFLPEQYILRGLIYQKFCHFRAAKQALGDFREQYHDAISAIRRGDAVEGVSMVVDAALRQKGAKASSRRLAQLEREKEKVGELLEGPEDEDMVAHLGTLYSMLVAKAEHAHRRELVEATRFVAEALLSADEEANLLDYEVGVSIYRPLVGSSKRLIAKDKAEEVPASGVRIYYPFDDEFWSDELPDMRFLIRNRCPS